MTSNYDSLSPLLTVETDGAVRIVTIDNGDLNAVDAGLHQALVDVWGLLDADTEARAILLTARGRHFSAGGDFSWFGELIDNPEEREKTFRDGQAIIDSMLRCRLPIVAGVHGGAVGLGASIVMLSDHVVMTRTAFLRDPHVSVGLTAGDGAIAWPLSMSAQQAKQYVLLGDRLTAEDAYRVGAANEIVDDPTELHAHARAVVQRYAALPPQAAQTTKRAINMYIEQSIRSAAEFALASERNSYHTPEFQNNFARPGLENASAHSTSNGVRR